VVKGSPTKESCTAIHSLPLNLGKPVAVIQASAWRCTCAVTTAAAFCLLCQVLGFIFSTGISKVMHSQVAPSTLEQTPTCMAMADDCITS